MARSTVTNLIERTRRQLASSLRNEVNVLGVNANTTATTLTMTYELVNSLSAGSILSIGTELMRVISVDRNAKEAVVIRGWQDSDGEAHVVGDEVMINPRFTRFDIYDAMIDEISSWAPRLFTVTDYQWTVTDDDETVELPASMSDALGVISMRRQWDTNSSAWPQIDFRLMRGSVATWDAASTSGLLIRMLPNLGVARTGTVFAQIARPIDVTTTPPTEASDLVADYGLAPSMLDLLQIGIKMRLMGDDEHARSARIVQDEPRRTEEVPAGTALTVSQTLRSVYDRRLGDEVKKLQAKYPMRSW